MDPARLRRLRGPRFSRGAARFLRHRAPAQVGPTDQPVGIRCRAEGRSRGENPQRAHQGRGGPSRFQSPRQKEREESRIPAGRKKGSREKSTGKSSEEGGREEKACPILS